MSARLSFDRELELLNTDLIKMAAMVEEAITKSIEALGTSNRDMAREIIDQDRQVDDIEKAIEARSLRLLMRQQPVARDLRAISTTLKMITDLERIGDQAADIADLSMRFEEESAMQVSEHLEAMASIASAMVHESVESYIHNDPAHAGAIIKRDDEVDALFVSVKNDLIEKISQNQDLADDAIDTLMVAKYLERIADHAVNVCEWVIFYSTGLHKKTQIL
ncbi:phosphate signaling complex protein PhoU [Zongyangia hominis]|uniref:Phosphate-specific transport system accessory protein PhoU n=1 Tax=Zongyangia hominis TaxID=2763677 RepID=A0A926EB59_9FIRM|nr:phosphate signaling complex protein PhoU [Zongyangia hominis]MBC8570667.1 phosphate signaling complex protein PhoU [Zongyangia hominis]